MICKRLAEAGSRSVVTGGASGVGRATAKRFAGGGRVDGLSSRPPRREPPAGSQAQFVERGREEVIELVGDVTSTADCQRAIKQRWLRPERWTCS